MRILFHMGQHGPDVGITQLAAALSINKTTVHRLLGAMQKFELIEKNPHSERYRLGLKLHELGSRAIESRTLQMEARRYLQEMSARSNEAVSLAVPAPGGVICLDRIDSAHSVITVRTVVGARFAPHCTAAGKAVLANLPEAQIDEILSRVPLTRFTPLTITKVVDVKATLSDIRQRGYAIDEQELERGLSGVAAPIFNAAGELLGAVGMAGPTPRFRNKELAEKISLVCEIAAKISTALGRNSQVPLVALNDAPCDPATAGRRT